MLCVPVLAQTSDAPSAPARALRVAYIHQHLPLGGVETHILNLCGALNRSLADPTVFLTRTEGPLAGAVRATGAPVRLLPVETFDAAARRWVPLQSGFSQLVQALSGFDVAVTFYGGGNGTQWGVKAAHAAGVTAQVCSASRARRPRPASNPSPCHARFSTSPS